MYVENLFPCSILGIFGRFSLSFVFELILGSSGLVSVLYLGHFLVDSLQTLYMG